jgi:hypothetical protein
MTQALMRYRQFGALQHEDDEPVEDWMPKRKIAFYGS